MLIELDSASNTIDCWGLGVLLTATYRCTEFCEERGTFSDQLANTKDNIKEIEDDFMHTCSRFETAVIRSRPEDKRQLDKEATSSAGPGDQPAVSRHSSPCARRILAQLSS